MKRLAIMFLLASVVVLAVRALHDASDEQRAGRAPREASDRSARDNRRVGSRPPRQAEVGVSAADHRQPAAGEPAEDELSERWDDLGPAQRIQAGTEQFHKALAAIEAGSDVKRNVVAAESALSVLRPELYATPRGRERHRALEAELERAAGDL